MAEQWITVNGRHVLIKDGESAEAAISRSIINHNEDIKEQQIAKSKAEADRLNGKGEQKTFSSTQQVLNDFQKYLDKARSGDKPEKLVADFEKSVGYKIPDRFKARLVEHAMLHKTGSRGGSKVKSEDFSKPIKAEIEHAAEAKAWAKAMKR